MSHSKPSNTPKLGLKNLLRKMGIVSLCCPILSARNTSSIYKPMWVSKSSEPVGLEIDGSLASWSSPDTVSLNMIQRPARGCDWNVRQTLVHVPSALWTQVNFLQTFLLSIKNDTDYVQVIILAL